MSAAVWRPERDLSRSFMLFTPLLSAWSAIFLFFCAALDDCRSRRFCKSRRALGRYNTAARNGPCRRTLGAAHLISCWAGVPDGHCTLGRRCTADLSRAQFLPCRAGLPCLDRRCCAGLWNIPAGPGAAAAGFTEDVLDVIRSPGLRVGLSAGTCVGCSPGDVPAMPGRDTSA